MHGKIFVHSSKLAQLLGKQFIDRTNQFRLLDEKTKTRIIHRKAIVIIYFMFNLLILFYTLTKALNDKYGISVVKVQSNTFETGCETVYPRGPVYR